MSGLPVVACPCCNVQLPLEGWIANTAAREAFLALAGLHPSMRLPMTCLRYVGLFAPIKHTMRWERIADLLNEVRELISTGRVTWKHQELPAPLDYWLTGMETLLAKGDLRRPLANHNYLKAVVAGMSEQAQAGDEQRRIAGGRGETPVSSPLSQRGERGDSDPAGQATAPSIPPSPPFAKGGEKKPRHNREAAAKALADISEKLKGAK